MPTLELVESSIKFGVVAAAPVAGSFLGVAVLRSGTSSILNPARSHCSHCGASLSARDLVPLISWTLSGGRCRHCGDRLGWFYPGMEIAALGVALWVAQALSGWAIAVGCLLGWTLLTIALIDLRRLIVPDALSLPLLLAGLGLAVATDLSGTMVDPWDALLGATLGYGAFALLGRGYERVRGMPGLGLGDAKLLAAAGAWVGVAGLPSVVLVAALAGLAGALLAGATERDRRIPFAPALCLGFWVVWLHGPLAVGGL
jgi:Type II secretory pathway, prepilin signal peptidase PulO and related peptidases